MNKKRVMTTLLLLTFATSALAIGSAIAQKSERQNDPKATASSPNGLSPVPADLGSETPPQPAQPNPLGERPAQPAEQEVPQYVVYGQVFRHIKELHKKADEEERQGRDGAHLRKLYKEMARLDDRQAALLDEVAADVNREVEKFNRQAKKIISETRAKYPEGKIPMGEQPPAPPAELAQLSASRRDRVVAARERLRHALGEDEFKRFDEFVQQRVKPGIRRLGDGGRRPEAAPGQ